MTPRRRILLAVVSDLHVGSTVALCPPGGIALEDGGRYTPNVAQVWIWDQWIRYRDILAGYRRGGWKIVLLVNGEFIDGLHHESSQLAANSPEIMAAAAVEVMMPMVNTCDALYVTRGTEAHSGHGAASDFAIARELGAVRDPDSGQCAAYQWRIDVGGVVVDAAHHVTGGSRMTTRGNNIRAEMQDAILAGCPPDIMIRSHVHTYADTGRMFWPRQACVTPAWQLKTAFAHRVTRLPAREVGGVVFEIEGGAAGMVKPITFRVPERAAHVAKV